jgi:hypothetical protein
VSDTTGLLTRVELRAALDLGEKQIEYLRGRGLPDAGVGPHNRRYFRLADVQAWLAEYWREKERLAAEARELAEVPATPRPRSSAGGGAAAVARARPRPDHEGPAKPLRSNAGAGGLARAISAQSAGEEDTDGPGQHGGNHAALPTGSPTSWGAITAGTTLAGLSWWDACKAVGRAP